MYGVFKLQILPDMTVYGHDQLKRHRFLLISDVDEGPANESTRNI